jgi:hypothetical protein
VNDVQRNKFVDGQVDQINKDILLGIPTKVMNYDSSKEDIRVNIFPNGSKFGGRVLFILHTDSWDSFLQKCRGENSKKISRIFNEKGAELFSLDQILPGDSLFLSKGENFVIPNGTLSPSLSYSL